MKINFKELAKTVVNAGKEHSPEISTGVGIAFMVAGAVFSVVATVKTMRTVADAKAEKLTEIAANVDEYGQLSDEDQQRYDEICRSPMPIKEVAPIIWKHWVAPVGFLTAGAGCIIFSDREQAKRIASVTSALACHVADAKDYKEAVKEAIGEEKEEEVEGTAGKRKAKRSLKEDEGPKDIFDTGTGNQLFYDYYSDRWVKASPLFMDQKLLELNKLMHYRYKRNDFDEYVTLNDWYNIVGIHTTGLGDEMGFPVTDDDIEFCNSSATTGVTDEGYSFRVIRFRNGPSYIYNGI